MPEDRWRRVREFICCFYKAEERAESIKVEIIHEVVLQQQRQEEEDEEEVPLKVKQGAGIKGRHFGQKGL